ncbi:radical SAM protein [Natrarchaeobaculum sulfurireducens]|uniref:Radical SAM superfamily enzyme n=1 Tax=Natrarchaeobaculum sulfurireducens TaxID=2044521 RepID=A0A346PBZ7_9EURY|nr:radical SAM protein [Natrarchaeobaculum sulfurireducens]AXR77042.1 Radical SAM superfamily enzyme [Natrarchaeobaculum sulfurireducens]
MSSHSTSDGHPGPPRGRRYDRTPLVITWEVTQACALACDHCRADATPDRDPNELTTGEGIDLFEQVADFGDRPPMLVLSGGDPLERPDLFELLEGARDTGLVPSVTPATTPSLDRETLAALADAGVGRVAVSLDGATAERHDAFRGETGTFDTALEAASAASELGLSIQVNTTVTARTAADLPEIADLVEELGAVMWEVFFLIPVGRGAELEQLSPPEAANVAAWLAERSREAPYRIITVEAPFFRRVSNERRRARGEEPATVGTTGAGNGFVFVSATGEVYPSGFMPTSAGNVREESLVSIYRDSPLIQRLRDRTAFDGPCGACPAAETCGGSRSRAFAATGEPTGSDPLCPWVATDHGFDADEIDPDWVGRLA